MLSLGREVPTSAQTHTLHRCHAHNVTVRRCRISQNCAVNCTAAQCRGAASLDRGSRRGSKVTAAPVCLHTLMSNNSHLKSQTKLHIPLYTFMSKNTMHPKYLKYNFQQPKEIVEYPVQQHPPSPDLYLGHSIVRVFHG